MDTEATIRTIIEAYNAQDLDRVASLLAEDMTYRINAHPECGPYHANCDCKATFFEAVGEILADWQVRSYVLADLIVSGDRGAAQINVEMDSRHAQTSFKSQLALFMTVRDGLVSEIVEYHDTAAAGRSRVGFAA